MQLFTDHDVLYVANQTGIACTPRTPTVDRPDFGTAYSYLGKKPGTSDGDALRTCERIAGRVLSWYLAIQYPG